MRVCTLKNGQVIDRRGNVLYTLKHKGSLLTAKDLFELRQVSKDLDLCIVTASQTPKESDTSKLPRVYGHDKSRGDMLTPEELEQIKVYVEPAAKSVPLNLEDWKKDSQEEDI